MCFCVKILHEAWNIGMPKNECAMHYNIFQTLEKKNPMRQLEITVKYKNIIKCPRYVTNIV